MAKRFTDSSKFRKGWIRKLPASYKLLWCYITDDCSNAGIWEVDFEIAQLILGVDMSATKALQLFNADELRVVEFDAGAKWFIPGFIDFQYGELIPACNPHKPVIAQLRKYDLEKYLKVPKEGLNNPLERVKDKDKEQDKDKDKDKVKDKGVVRGFVKPSPEEVTEYAKSIGFELEGQYFCDKNDAIGWVVGKNKTPMKDWQAAVRTWKTNNTKYQQENKPQEKPRTHRIVKLVCSNCSHEINTRILINQDVCGLTCKECGRQALQEIL